MKIGIDIMGGDYAPGPIISGVLMARHELPSDIQLCLFGDEQTIRSSLLSAGGYPAQFEIHHAPEVIGMGEHATKAFNQKQNSSIVVGFESLRKKEIDAFASAGNTGAMLVGSVFHVGILDGIIRPCIASIVPKENGGVGIILDVGITPDGKPEFLYQYGILGSLYAQYVYNISSPKVGLINIGEEEEKGNILSQAAFKLMKGSKDFNFIGNIENRDLFKDKVDVVVCDGFTGNIVLKQVETMYRLIVKQGFRNEFIDRFNYENYGGTPVLGINSTVVIGHGISNNIAIKNMIIHTKEIHEAKLCEKINNAMKQYAQVKAGM